MARKQNRGQAVGYLRTSSPTNVGGDKDSEPRQRRAIQRYAKAAGFDVVDWFYDASVSGADPIESRPGFASLLNRVEGNGVRVVLVEDASRFARDLMAQELGIIALLRLGMRVLAANGDDLTVTDDPMKKAMRQMAGVLSELEKSRLVAKLKAARDRKRAVTGKCGGRKSHAEANPDVVALAKSIAGRGGRVSLRTIAAELEAAGYVNANGKQYAAKSVMKMLGD